MATFSRPILYALTVAFLSATPLAADTGVFNDDFSSGNEYSIFNFNRSDVPEPEDNQADISIAEFVFDVGGNPGDSLLLTHTHDVSRDNGGAPDSGDGVTNVQSILTNESVVYNPSTQGAIQSVTFSIDYLATDLFNSVFFTIRSNGGNISGFDTPITDGQWHTYTFTGLQSDFGSQDFGGAGDLNFGFGFTSSGVDVFDELESRQLVVDNFNVTVSAIPEPSTVFVSALAGIALFCRRRRI